MWLNWLADLFTWWIFNALEAFELKVTDISFSFNSGNFLIVNLWSTGWTFTHNHSLLDVFNANTDDSLLKILISTIVIFIFVFIFHLLPLIFNIITFDFSNIFILTSLRLLSRRSVSSANSVGAPLRFHHACADLVLVLLVGTLLTLLTPEHVSLSLSLFLLVLFKISVVTSHWYMRNIRNSLIQPFNVIFNRKRIFKNVISVVFLWLSTFLSVFYGST